MLNSIKSKINAVRTAMTIAAVTVVKVYSLIKVRVNYATVVVIGWMPVLGWRLIRGSKASKLLAMQLKAANTVSYYDTKYHQCIAALMLLRA